MRRLQGGGPKAGHGVSLTEILLAFGIITAALIPMIGLFSSTSRISSKVSVQFRECVLGQLILEAIKGRQELDPYFLSLLSQSYGFKSEPWVDSSGASLTALILTASVSDAAAFDSSMVMNLPASSFLTDFLFNHSGTALYTASNRDSLSFESTQFADSSLLPDLRRNFRDLAFRVIVAMGPLSGLDPEDASVDPSPVRSAFTRQIRVEIKQFTPISPQFDPPDVAFETIIEAPGESLPIEAFKKRQADTDDYSYPRDQKEAQESLQGVLEGGLLPLEIMDLLEDVYLTLSQSVGEAVRTEGVDLGFGIEMESKGFQEWIQFLLPIDSAYARMKVAKLEEDTMVAIFRGFKKSEIPIRQIILRAGVLDVLADDLVKKIEEKKEDFEEALDKDPHRKIAQEIFQGSLRVAQELIFWIKFFEDGKNFEALTRPSGWPDRYRQATQNAIQRRITLRTDPTLTPLNQVKNLKHLIEVSKAIKLMDELPQAPAEDVLAVEQVERLPDFLPLSQFLVHDNLDKVEDLRARNEPYISLCKSMAELLGDDGPYQGVIDMVRPDGKWRQDLDALISMMAVMQIQADITSVVNSVNARIRQAVK